MAILTTINCCQNYPMNMVWPFDYFQVHVPICKRQSDLFQRFNLDVIEVVNLQQRNMYEPTHWKVCS